MEYVYQSFRVFVLPIKNAEEGGECESPRQVLNLFEERRTLGTLFRYHLLRSNKVGSDTRHQSLRSRVWLNIFGNGHSRKCIHPRSVLIRSRTPVKHVFTVPTGDPVVCTVLVHLYLGTYTMCVNAHTRCGYRQNISKIYHIYEMSQYL